jgi:hypothetical protein
MSASEPQGSDRAREQVCQPSTRCSWAQAPATQASSTAFNVERSSCMSRVSRSAMSSVMSG